MAQMQTQPQFQEEQTEKRLKYKLKADYRLVTLCIISFLISRTVIFDVIAPFGLAFYVVNYKKKINATLIGIFAAVGMLTVMDSAMQPGKYIIAMILFSVAYNYLSHYNEKWMPAIAAIGSLFVTGLVFVAVNGFIPYDFVMLIIECAACFTVILVIEQTVNLIQIPLPKHHIISAEEAISLCVTVGLCLVGFTQIVLPWDISLSDTICALIILLVSLCGGLSIGAATGIGCGIINSIGQYPLSGTMGIYGLCGLVAGLMRRFGKAGVMLGFICTNLLISLSTNSFSDGVFNTYEQIAALAIFWLIPKSMVEHISEMINTTFPESGYSTKMKDIITQKLLKVSCSFEQLAETLHKLTNWRETGKNVDVTVVFDEAATRVCKRCTNRFRCWQREFNTTYNALMHVVPVLEEYGNIEVAHLPEYFANRCIKVKEYVAEINKQFDNYRVESVWQQKIDNSREMVTDQLYGVSKIIGNLSKELTAEIQFDPILEEELMSALNEKNIHAKDITAIKNADNRYEISLTMSPCGGKGLCTEMIVPLTSMITGTAMCNKTVGCSSLEKKDKCILRLAQQERFTINCAAVKQAKDGQNINGDNYSNMPVSGGRYIMAISDGMGSGKKAASQSNTTVELLEKFLNAGFDKASAIKLINSVLLLRSADETFATIDIAMMDLFSGNTEFIKIGANTTYLKRGNKLDRIISTSLPAGILGDVDIESEHKILQGNDFIIMLSDGVENVQDLWIEAYLNTIKDSSPEILANHLMRKAIERSGGVSDDMTILVGKVSEVA